MLQLVYGNCPHKSVGAWTLEGLYNLHIETLKWLHDLHIVLSDSIPGLPQQKPKILGLFFYTSENPDPLDDLPRIQVAVHM